jgi:hypothetical protein
MSVNLTTRIVTTTPYTILVADDVIFVNVTSGPASIVLPVISASSSDDSSGTKRSFYIKDYSGTSLTNPITITAAGGKLINGVSFAIINGGYAHIQVVYDGTNWMTIA